MTNVTTTDLVAIDNSSAVTTINTNIHTLRDEFDKVVYKDGREELTGNLNANSKRIINLPDGLNATEPVTVGQLPAIVSSLGGGDQTAQVIAEAILRTAADGLIRSDLLATTGSSVLGHIASPSGAVGSTVQAKLRENITPEDFGAVGDGVADDSAAILAFVNAIQSTGYVGQLRKGVTYLCTTWTAQVTTAKIRIIGNGATIKGPAASTNFLYPITDFECEGVTFDRWGSAFTRLLADSGSFTYVRVKQNRFLNMTGIAVNLERPVSVYEIDGNEWKACSGGYALKIGENTYANQDTYKWGKVTNNNFSALTGTGAASTAAALIYGHSVVISGNVVDGVQADSGEAWGIYTKVRYATVTGNIVRNINSTTGTDIVGINIKGNVRASTAAPQGFACSITGNNISNVGTLGTKGGGIRLQGDDHVCVGNNIENSGLSGIVVDEAAAYFNVKVAENRIYFSTLNSAVGAIRVEGGGTGITVQNNTCYQVAVAVRVQANITSIPLTDVFVSGNIARSCTYGMLFDAQASCTLNKCRLESNVIDGGTAFLNNGSPGTTTNLSILDNDTDRCTTFLNGTLPAGSMVRGDMKVSTADATLTTLIPFLLADESAYTFECAVMGKKSDSSDRAMYHRKVLVYRDAAAAATIQGAAADMIAPVESNAAWDAAFSVNSNSVLMRVTGVAATTINWRGNFTLVGL